MKAHARAEKKEKAWNSPEAVAKRDAERAERRKRKVTKKAQQCVVCEQVVQSLVKAVQPRLLRSVGGKDPYGRQLEKKKKVEAEAAATHTVVTEVRTLFVRPASDPCANH